MQKCGELAERSKAADCKSAGLRPTEVRILHSPPSCASGSNSVGRVTAFQAVGRGFEPRLPLQKSVVGAQWSVKRTGRAVTAGCEAFEEGSRCEAERGAERGVAALRRSESDEAT